MSEKSTISAILIIKNEAPMLNNCLKTLNWCDEIVVVDDGSTDKSGDIAKKHDAKVINFTSDSFADLREKGAQEAQSDWIFYIDADERVTPQLANEILHQVNTSEATAYSVSRKNILYGSHLEYGGWQDDRVERLFKKDSLQGWYGQVHESPRYSGQLSHLSQPLIHLTHRNTISGLIKSAEWTPIEARELFAANTPRVSFFTLLRKGGMEFLRRIFFKQGYRDGMPGLVEATVQAINRVLVYIQVWELQQNPSLEEAYQQQEVEIQKLWRQSRVSE